MEVSYTLTPDDLRYIWQWGKVSPLALVFRQVATFAVLTLVGGWLDHQHDFELSATFSFLLLFFTFLIRLLRQQRILKRKVQDALTETPHRVGPRRVRLVPQGVYFGGQMSEHLYPWQGLGRPRRDSRYFLIEAIGASVIPIPLSAFTDRKDAELFWTALLAYKMSGGGAEVAHATDNKTVWPPAPTSNPPRTGG